MKKKNILAVITARGGSKGVPRKNIKNLRGKPVLWYSLSSCLKSKSLTHVVVSSDDKEILDIARSIGGDEIVLKRPKKIAQDNSLSIDAIQHAVIDREEKYKIKYDYVVLIQPTTPFILPEDIDACIKIALTKKADTVVSVYEVNDSHPVKIKKIDKKGKLVHYVDSIPETVFRRQDLPSAYKRNGGIYVNTRETTMNKNSYHGTIGICYPYIMPALRSVDINDIVDFYLCEVVADKLFEQGLFK